MNCVFNFRSLYVTKCFASFANPSFNDNLNNASEDLSSQILAAVPMGLNSQLPGGTRVTLNVNTLSVACTHMHTCTNTHTHTWERYKPYHIHRSHTTYLQRGGLLNGLLAACFPADTASHKSGYSAAIAPPGRTPRSQ